MSKLRLQDLQVGGKKVLMRVDFNVPLNQDGTVADDTRLKESLPSIQYVIERGGTVILMSHLGRPKNGPDPKLSLSPCAAALSKLLKHPVQMADDCVGPSVEKLAHNLKPKDVLLLENLRFYPAEENPSNDPSFAKQLAALADFYVNDAFGTAHRNHSSTATITAFFPGKAAAGLLMQKEIAFLGELLAHPKRPLYAIIGGAKISTKIGVLKSLLSKVDAIFLCGGMAYTFFQAQGLKIGDSIHEEDQILVAKEFLIECRKKNIPCYLPTDLVLADAFAEDAALKIVSVSQGIPDGWQGMDIGPQTLSSWKEIFRRAATIFWNGPPGVFEFPRFAEGTSELAKTIAALNAVTVIGGGDSVAAINRLGLSSRFSHVSTGGGAALEYLEYGHLPGIDALSDIN